LSPHNDEIQNNWLEDERLDDNESGHTTDEETAKYSLPSTYPEAGDACRDDSSCDPPSFYYPINIFLNEFDGRCTADCTQEGRHYVNPSDFENYDPNLVLDWPESSTGRLMLTDFFPCFDGEGENCGL
jgi:hypothetical protein